MKTITSKTAINGAKLWYVDGKRTSRDNAAATSIANGRENLSNLVAGLTSDPAVYNDIGIVADMKSEFGDRYVEHFYFATAEDAVTAARKIVALGKQVHRLTIDNGRPYPSNIRYADTARGKLIFINGFERFNEADATVEDADTISNDSDENETAKFEVGKTYAAKKSVLFDSQINMTVIKRTKCYVTIQIDDDKDDIRRCKVVDEYGVEKIHLHESNAIGGDYEFSAQDVVTDSNEVSDSDGHIDGYDESAFDLLPTVDELNDCRSDIEKEFDEFDAKYTDRDARFNHGERHAAKLEKKLRELDPTVEVTYDINEDGEDTFYLRFGKYVYRSPFATLDAVEETFHLWREDDEPTETKPTVDDQIETLEADEAVIEAKINVLTAQFNETFKQSEDADKAFNRAWLNCESSGVQSPLKSKSDTLHAALDRICDELQPLRQRKAALTSELVDLYGRHSDLAGVKIVTINGTFKRVDVAPANVADLPAVNAKIAELKRVTHSLADEISDAQRSLERKPEKKYLTRTPPV